MLKSLIRKMSLVCLSLSAIFSQNLALAQWIQVPQTGTQPPARTLHCGAYDPVNDRWIIHGGTDAAGAIRSDSWTFNFSNQTWSQLPSSGGPAVMECAMTFVASNAANTALNRVLVLHGVLPSNGGNCGIGNTACNQPDAYLINLSTPTPSWVRLTQTGGASIPAARRGAGVVYNPLTKKVYFMGGDGQGPLGLFAAGDPQGFHLFVGNVGSSGTTLAWSKLAPSPNGVTPLHIDHPVFKWIPSPRSPNFGLIVLAGGRVPGSGLFQSSTYVWDGSTDSSGRPIWQFISNSYPDQGSEQGFDFDANTGFLTRFGGWRNIPTSTTVLNTTWILDLDESNPANVWKSRTYPTLPAPPARHNAAMIYRDTDHALYFFGGQDAAGTHLNETWRYTVQAATDSVFGQGCNTFSGNNGLAITSDPILLGMSGFNKPSIGTTYKVKVFAQNNSAPNAAVATLVGLSNPNTAFGNCTINSSGEFNRTLILNNNSESTIPYSLPNDPAYIGLPLFWQGFSFNSSNTIVTSPTLSSTVGF